VVFAGINELLEHQHPLHQQRKSLLKCDALKLTLELVLIPDNRLSLVWHFP